jgi:hypothetical protein
LHLKSQKMERFQALLSGSEEEAIVKLRALRDEHQGHMRADVALRTRTIRMDARYIRDTLSSVRAEARIHLNPSAVLSVRVLPMIHWRPSHEHFGGFRDTIFSYPSRSEQFDWCAYLDALDAAVDADEAAALAAVSA